MSAPRPIPTVRPAVSSSPWQRLGVARATQSWSSPSPPLAVDFLPKPVDIHTKCTGKVVVAGPPAVVTCSIDLPSYRELKPISVNSDQVITAGLAVYNLAKPLITLVAAL